MKTLIIMPMFYPVPAVEGGAVETLVDNYIKYNSDLKNNEIVIYTIQSDRISNINLEKYRNVEFRRINTKGFLYNCEKKIRGGINRVLKRFNKGINDVYISKIIKDIKQKNDIKEYNIIIVENVGRYVLPIRKLYDKKIVLHLHNDYLNISTFKNKEIYNACSEVWAVSGFIAKRANEIDISVPKASIVYNGIDTELFSKERINSREVRVLKDKYNIDNNDFIIMYIGRIMKEKGVKELIIAFKDLVNKNVKYKNLKLIVVGATKNSSKKEKKYYEELKQISELICSKIVFTGKVEYVQLPLLYSIANIQVVPSICNEAFGLTIAEGMAMKLPIIATDSGGIPEILQDVGIIIHKSNIVNEIKEKLEMLIENYELREQLSNNAFKKSDMYSNINYCKRLDKKIRNNEE